MTESQALCHTYCSKLLMFIKRLSDIMVIPELVCTFAVLPRGSGLRRGTTRERSEVDYGGLIKLSKFDHCGALSGSIVLRFLFMVNRKRSVVKYS